jgi:hypothetical protein
MGTEIIAAAYLNFENINITHNTALNLPLKVFFLPSEAPQHLLAGDLFEYSSAI